jgi:hypothetical protein
MDNASKHPDRGSSKLFSLQPHDHEGIATALGIARAEYQVKWWWKYGQPAIDLVRATIEVRPAQLGATVSQLMHLNGPEVQVTTECFPHGMPRPDVFRLEVEMRKAG